ncbi:MAG TPA: site-specific integrase, partial [Candidatus Limnocylindrales bacterium]
MTGREALDRFLLGLRARDASEHTVRSYTTTVTAYLGWLDARGVSWRTPARADLRAYLAVLAGAGARSTVGQRLAAIRSFHRFAARAGLAPGDPWGSIGTPRLGRRLPRVLEVDQIERLLAAVDDAEDLSRTAPQVAAAITLRDRAIVEVAYAAGLRISELAGAPLASID